MFRLIGSTLACTVLLFGARVAVADDVPPGETADWRPALYGFCMEISDARDRSLTEQVEMLAELGFEGVGYPLWLDGSLEANLAAIDKAGLEVYLLYTVVNVDPQETAYDPVLPEALAKLQGRPVTVAVLLQGLPPADPRGREPALRILRELGDAAAEHGLRIAVYHHTGDWAEGLPFTLEVVEETGHEQVGVCFNLCHWLRIDGDRDYRPLLREHAHRIFAATINGATQGATTWTDGLIRPLDEGDFDNRALLATLCEAGYRGPVGLMCYGIPGDAREHLARSMAVWKSWWSEARQRVPGDM